MPSIKVIHLGHLRPLTIAWIVESLPKYDLVHKGVTRHKEVRCLKEFVERELFADVSPPERPKWPSRKYYPTRQYLRKYITKAIATSKYCKDDQELLCQKVNEWQATSTRKCLYRPKGQDDNSGKGSLCQKFIFVHKKVAKVRIRAGSTWCYLQDHQVYSSPILPLCSHKHRL